MAQFRNRISFVAILKWVGAIIMFMSVFVFYPWIQHGVVGNCEAQNIARREGNIRADAMREFIKIAADRVQDQAAAEVKSSPSRAATDFKAAAAYQALMSSFRNLPLRKC